MEKCYVLYSAAMTIDGKTATRSGDTSLSDEQDWKIVHRLRKDSDAIMVGSSTVIKDDPKLTVQYYEEIEKFPIRVIVDSKLITPMDAKVFNYQLDLYKTIIATTDQADPLKMAQLKTKGILCINTGPGPHVNLQILLSKLYDMNIKRILLEGGGTLAWGLLEENLIDELRLFIAPFLVGGKSATSLIMGDGYNDILSSRKFRLKKMSQRDSYIVLEYLRDH